MVGEREYKFLEILSAEKEISQRKLAKTLGISLGMTNLILKNLIKKGYVKIKGLNRKKVRYLLTPRGFSEKARKSYNYTVKTIREFSRYVENLRNFILNEYEKGT
ncbi:MAG: winged helix-turn-helix transcriptional regulator, partial [Elusimicrobia bacterium]|nr:winged helix-turn-helix transcriptional regulator [Elusimicrobiota bacterium]